MGELASLAAILGIYGILALGERRWLQPDPTWRGIAPSLAVLILSLVHGRFFHTDVGFVRWPTSAWRLLAAATVCTLLMLALAVMHPFLPGKPQLVIPLQYVHLILLVPFAEEAYFRGALFDHLRRGLGGWKAVGICSILFGLLHWHAGVFWLMATFSCIVCLLVLRYRSICLSLQLHIAWNTFVLVNRSDELAVRLGLAGMACLVLVLLTGLSRVFND